MIKKGLYQMNKPKIAAVSAAVAMALSMSPAVNAVEINAGSWNGSWDTTITAGSSWRVEDRDLNLIGKTNIESNRQYFVRINELGQLVPIEDGYTGPYLLTQPQLDPANSIVPPGSWSNNGDNGNLNFDKGDTFSKAIKVTTELGLEHDSGFGFFVRASGVHDRELLDNPELRTRPISTQSAKNHGDEIRLLDAYIYHTVAFEETSLQWRLGQQVVSWGESTFIQHGLSEINAIDVTKLRVPGAEIKEGLIPVETLWASMDLSDTLSLEAYVQFEWEEFRTDEPGTYFATQDFAGEYNPDVQTSIHLGFSQFSEGFTGTEAIRTADRDPDDDGQYGIKLGWLAEDWNYTEFGFYFVNYHNKRPLITANAHNGVEVTGFFEYPEDIQMYGFSFNTSTEGGTSIAGEITYRIDEPLQVDDVELLFATLEPVGSIPSGTSQIPGGAELGEEISGYRLLDTVQAQATFTKFMGPTWGADQWVLLAEIGANMVLDMPEESELRFNAPGTGRSGNLARQSSVGDGLGFIDPTSPCSLQGIPVACEGVTENSFASDFSWGYRLLSKWDYTDVIGGWNVSPRIIYQHDVKGTTPGPISNFIEDRVAVTLGVTFEYQSVWRADIGYSAFSGAGTANLLSDRDFVAANISYSF